MAITEPTYEEKLRNKKQVREAQSKHDLYIAGALILLFHPKSPEGQAFKGALLAYCVYNHFQRPTVILKETDKEKTDKQTTQSNNEQQ